MIPAIIIMLGFRLMMWHDDVSLNDLNSWSLAIMLALSTIWPVGLIAMLGILGEASLKRLGWMR